MRGVFTISLDFELHWGGFEKWKLSSFEFRVPGSGVQVRQSSASGHQQPTTSNQQPATDHQQPATSNQRPTTGNRPPATSNQQPVTDHQQPATYNDYFLRTRAVIPRMLSLFEQYQIHATWAGVGMLMHRDRESLIRNFPSHKPSYINKELSAYHYIEEVGIGENEDDDPFHYADSLVKKILSTKYQELGSHSFAHFYCNEEGQTLEQFRADLQSAQKAASAYGVKLRSLVFPRNQFNDDYLKVCYEEGFDSVRSNPLDWFWNIESTQSESGWKRLNRGLDAYFPIGKKNIYSINNLVKRNGFPLCLPASRLLRPYRPSELFLNQFKINRIITEMQNAARNNEVYHLWWHPHNFGNYPEQSLTALEQISRAFKKCQEQWGMESLGMGEVTDLVRQKH